MIVYIWKDREVRYVSDAEETQRTMHAPMSIATATTALLSTKLAPKVTLTAALLWFPPVWLGVEEEPLWLELEDEEAEVLGNECQ